MIRGCREKTALYRGRRGPCGPHLPLKFIHEKRIANKKIYFSFLKLSLSHGNPVYRKNHQINFHTSIPAFLSKSLPILSFDKLIIISPV